MSDTIPLIDTVDLDEDEVTFADGTTLPIELWEDTDGERFDFAIEDVAKVWVRAPSAPGKHRFYVIELPALTPETIIQ